LIRALPSESPLETAAEDGLSLFGQVVRIRDQARFSVVEVSDVMRAME